MTQSLRTPDPLRVAIVGAGPAGFFVAERLFKQRGLTVQVDMFERLPAPFGLVRFGVAPDHQKIKSVVRTFAKTASNKGFRFFGNVEIGTHISVAELSEHYHQVCIATGAQADRRLNIPGEDLAGSHPATEFVAWYNGHPDFRDRSFDLSVERAVIVGVGNVALDVARVLCRNIAELERTDIANHALEALRYSRIKEVVLLGRRGPVQAAFSVTEIRELGQMHGVRVVVPPQDLSLDAESHEDAENCEDTSIRRKLEALSAYAGDVAADDERKITLRFLVSPIELSATEHGRVGSVRLVQNELYRDATGSLRSRATDRFEILQAGLVLRSAGYRGVPVPGLPFDREQSLIPNEKGRVVDRANGEHIPGVYVCGWIKRWPTGVIGTNKLDASETVESMFEDAAVGKTTRPPHVGGDGMERLLRDRQPDCVTFDDWMRIDALEVSQGAALGRPRVKFTSRSEMLAHLRRSFS